MYRRVVSLLLLPCVLLTQATSFGHCHGGSSPAGHDPRPHIHLNAKPTPHSHDHSHPHRGPSGHRHHGDDVPEPDTQPTPLSDHDSDAVFFTSVDVVISERSAVDEELAVSLLCAVTGLNLPTALLVNPSHEAANWTHAPPPRSYACPLYLWQLTLLI